MTGEISSVSETINIDYKKQDQSDSLLNSASENYADGATNNSMKSTDGSDNVENVRHSVDKSKHEIMQLNTIDNNDKKDITIFEDDDKIDKFNIINDEKDESEMKQDRNSNIDKKKDSIVHVDVGKEDNKAREDADENEEHKRDNVKDKSVIAIELGSDKIDQESNERGQHKSDSNLNVKVDDTVIKDDVKDKKISVDNKVDTMDLNRDDKGHDVISSKEDVLNNKVEQEEKSNDH